MDRRSLRYPGSDVQSGSLLFATFVRHYHMDLLICQTRHGNAPSKYVSLSFQGLSWKEDWGISWVRCTVNSFFPVVFQDSQLPASLGLCNNFKVQSVVLIFKLKGRMKAWLNRLRQCVSSHKEEELHLRDGPGRWLGRKSFKCLKSKVNYIW